MYVYVYFDHFRNESFVMFFMAYFAIVFSTTFDMFKFNSLNNFIGSTIDFS